MDQARRPPTSCSVAVNDLSSGNNLGVDFAKVFFLSQTALLSIVSNRPHAAHYHQRLRVREDGENPSPPRDCEARFFGARH
jgi:hypothetical protein